MEIDLTKIKKRQRYTADHTFTLAEVRKLMWQAFAMGGGAKPKDIQGFGSWNHNRKQLQDRWPKIFYQKPQLRKDEREHDKAMTRKLRAELKRAGYKRRRAA